MRTVSTFFPSISIGSNRRSSIGMAVRVSVGMAMTSKRSNQHCTLR